MRSFLPLLALLLPLSAQAASLREFTGSIVVFVNASVVPLIYAIAFLVFLIGMTRYFFLEQGEEGREKGKQLMLWGIIGFVVMFSVWGIVNLLLRTFGVDGA
ncbi:MAG TPA: hypothetical protein VGE23_01795 [Candidatus Paceibacterota bacterium]